MDRESLFGDVCCKSVHHLIADMTAATIRSAWAKLGHRGASLNHVGGGDHFG